MKANTCCLGVREPVHNDAMSISAASDKAVNTLQCQNRKKIKHFFQEFTFRNTYSKNSITKYFCTKGVLKNVS